MNQEASPFGGDTESGEDESESSGEDVEMVTSEANDIEREKYSARFWKQRTQRDFFLTRRA